MLRLTFESYLDALCPIENAGATDCDGNGDVDICEVRTGAARNCNDDGDGDLTDEVPDICEIDAGTLDDADGDGIADICDNLPSTSNPIQIDCDGDGVGEDRDAADIDGDGVPNVDDNCICTENPEQRDCDGNGEGDACQFPLEMCHGYQVPEYCWEYYDTDPQDGIPDYLDCNRNSIEDQYEVGEDSDLDTCAAGEWSVMSIAPGDERDTDFNDVIDECEGMTMLTDWWSMGYEALCLPIEDLAEIEPMLTCLENGGDDPYPDSAAAPDFDRDCDVDQDDFGMMQLCVTGPDITVFEAVAAGLLPRDCLLADLNCDGTVTPLVMFGATDFQVFENYRTGPTVSYLSCPHEVESGGSAASIGNKTTAKAEPLVDSGGPLELLTMGMGPVASIDVAGDGGASMTVTEDAPGAGWTGTFLLQTGITCDSDITGFQYAINVNGGSDNDLFAYQFYLNRAHTAFGPTLFDAMTGPPTHWLNTDHWVACLNPLEDRPLSTVTIPEVVFNMNTSFDVAAAQFPGSLAEYRIATVGAVPVGTYVFSAGDVDPPQGFVVASASAGSGQLTAGQTFTLTVEAAE